MMQSPRRLHLVSEVLLKQWLRPVPGNDKQIIKFDVEFRMTRSTSPAGVCYTEDLVTVDALQFEDTWKSAEHNGTPVLAAINSGHQLIDGSIPVLMEFIAVHLIRSFSYWERHRRRLLESIRTLDLSNVSVDQLVTMYRKRNRGLYPPYICDRNLTEAEWRKNLEDLFNAGSYSADAMMDMFEVAKTRLSSYTPMIIHAGDPNAEFLIGDSPVLPLAGSNGLAEHPFGPTVGAYFFPLGPKYAVFTGKRAPELNGEEVDFLNRLEILNAQKWVVWHPGSNFTEFANSVLHTSS